MSADIGHKDNDRSLTISESLSRQGSHLKAEIDAANALSSNTSISTSNSTNTDIDNGSIKSAKPKVFKTEYKANFKPFDEYVYNEATDSFVKNHDSSIGKHVGHDIVKTPNANQSEAISYEQSVEAFCSDHNTTTAASTEAPWYTEVVKRIEKANEYRFKSEVGHNSSILQASDSSTLNHYVRTNHSSNGANILYPNEGNEDRIGASMSASGAYRFSPSDYSHRDDLIARMANNNNFSTPSNASTPATSSGNLGTSRLPVTRTARFSTKNTVQQPASRVASSRPLTSTGSSVRSQSATRRPVQSTYNVNSSSKSALISPAKKPLSSASKMTTSTSQSPRQAKQTFTANIQSSRIGNISNRPQTASARTASTTPTRTASKVASYPTSGITKAQPKPATASTVTTAQPRSPTKVTTRQPATSVISNSKSNMNQTNQRSNILNNRSSKNTNVSNVLLKGAKTTAAPIKQATSVTGQSPNSSPTKSIKTAKALAVAAAAGVSAVAAVSIHDALEKGNNLETIKRLSNDDMLSLNNHPVTNDSASNEIRLEEISPEINSGDVELISHNEKDNGINTDNLENSIDDIKDAMINDRGTILADEIAEVEELAKQRTLLLQSSDKPVSTDTSGEVSTRLNANEVESNLSFESEAAHVPSVDEIDAVNSVKSLETSSQEDDSTINKFDILGSQQATSDLLKTEITEVKSSQSSSSTINNLDFTTKQDEIEKQQIDNMNLTPDSDATITNVPEEQQNLIKEEDRREVKNIDLNEYDNQSDEIQVNSKSNIDHSVDSVDSLDEQMKQVKHDQEVSPLAPELLIESDIKSASLSSAIEFVELEGQESSSAILLDNQSTLGSNLTGGVDEDIAKQNISDDRRNSLDRNSGEIANLNEHSFNNNKLNQEKDDTPDSDINSESSNKDYISLRQEVDEKQINLNHDNSNEDQKMTQTLDISNSTSINTNHPEDNEHSKVLDSNLRIDGLDGLRQDDITTDDIVKQKHIAEDIVDQAFHDLHLVDDINEIKEPIQEQIPKKDSLSTAKILDSVNEASKIVERDGVNEVIEAFDDEQKPSIYSVNDGAVTSETEVSSVNEFSPNNNEEETKSEEPKKDKEIPNDTNEKSFNDSKDTHDNNELLISVDNLIEVDRESGQDEQIYSPLVKNKRPSEVLLSPNKLVGFEEDTLISSSKEDQTFESSSLKDDELGSDDTIPKEAETNIQADHQPAFVDENCLVLTRKDNESHQDVKLETDNDDFPATLKLSFEQESEIIDVDDDESGPLSSKLTNSEDELILSSRNYSYVPSRDKPDIRYNEGAHNLTKFKDEDGDTDSNDLTINTARDSTVSAGLDIMTPAETKIVSSQTDELNTIPATPFQITKLNDYEDDDDDDLVLLESRKETSDKINTMSRSDSKVDLDSPTQQAKPSDMLLFDESDNNNIKSEISANSLNPTQEQKQHS